jgi:RNA polymerase sigma factor (sigma-70 family)
MPRKHAKVYISDLRMELADRRGETEPQSVEGSSESVIGELREALEGLPPDIREVVERRFGFRGVEESLASIAADFGVSREAIRQRESRALLKLKRMLAHSRN